MEPIGIEVVQPTEVVICPSSMISIVDDDRIVREAMGDLVQSLGYEVATFESAEHFLESGCLAETQCLKPTSKCRALTVLNSKGDCSPKGTRPP
jgi:hypothetical protein